LSQKKLTNVKYEEGVMFRKLIAPLMVAFCLMCGQDAFAVEQIVFSPSSPMVDEKITFRAVGWDTTGCILWYFGDGDLNEDAIDPYTTTHSYSRAGTYTVRAHYGCDPSATPTTVTVRVGQAVGPEAAFSISFIQLRFADGKAYKTVSKDTADFRAYADIKYEGTGTLRIQWLVDGKPFTFSSQLLSFARQITLDTGKGLPTQIPGTHDVTLRFIQPAVEFEIPVIRYFVSLSDAGPPANIGLSIKSVTDSEGQSISILGDTIKAAGSENVIMTGEIENKEMRSVPLGRLSIYLGERLVDQQVIKNLNPGEKRAFDVSMLNPADTIEKATFVLADEAGRVLQKSTLNLQPVTPPETPPPSLAQNPMPPGVRMDFKIRPRQFNSIPFDPILYYNVANVNHMTLYHAFGQTWIMYPGIPHPWKTEISDQKEIMTFDPKLDRGQLNLRDWIDFEQWDRSGTRKTNYFIIEGSYTDINGKNQDIKWEQMIPFHYGDLLPPQVLDWWFVKTPAISSLSDGKDCMGPDKCASVFYDPAIGATVKIGVRYTNSGTLLPGGGPPVCNDVGSFNIGFKVLPGSWKGTKRKIQYLDDCIARDIYLEIQIPPNFKDPYQPYVEDKGTKYPAGWFIFLARLDVNQDLWCKNTGQETDMLGGIKLVPKPSIPDIDRFEAVRPKVGFGESTQLDIAVRNADSATISYGTSGEGYTLLLRNGAYTDLFTVSPQQITTYTLTAKNSQGPASGTATIYLPDDKPRITHFEFQPPHATAGDTVRLTYGFENAVNAVILDTHTRRRITKLSTDKPTASSVFHITPDRSLSYTLEVSNANGNEAKPAHLYVSRAATTYPDKPQIYYFRSSPSKITKGDDASTLSYKYAWADDAAIYDQKNQEVVKYLPIPAPGNTQEGMFQVKPSTTKSYTLMLINPKGTASNTAIVEVDPGTEGGPIPQLPQKVGNDQQSRQALRDVSVAPARANLDDLLKNAPSPGIGAIIPSKYPVGIWGGEKPMIHSFTTDKTSIAAGDKVVLTYEFSYAESARVFNAVKGNPADEISLDPGEPGKIKKGSLTLTPSQTARYGLRCVNQNGEALESLNITVHGGGMGTITDKAKP